MTRQWLRRMSFTFNDDAGPTVTGGRDGELRLTAFIDQTTIQSPNPAKLTIYNPSPTLIGSVKEFSKVMVRADYDGGQDTSLPVVYTGEVKQPRFLKETDYVTTMLEVYCADSANAYQQARVSKSIPAGYTPKDKVQAAADAMAPFGVTMGLVTADLSKPSFPRGIPLVGMARNLMRETALSAGATWSIQNSKLCVVDHKKPLPGTPIVLNSQTGMVGMPEQTGDGIAVRCLHNPGIQVHTLVQINESSIIRAVQDNNAVTGGTQSASNQDLRVSGAIAADGVYQVINIKRTLDTRGNDWYCDMLCIAQVGGNLNKGQLAQGLGIVSAQPTLGVQ